MSERGKRLRHLNDAAMQARILRLEDIVVALIEMLGVRNSSYGDILRFVEQYPEVTDMMNEVQGDSRT